MTEPKLHVSWCACFFAVASTLGIAQTTGMLKPAAGGGPEAQSPAMSELSPAAFKDPPAIYRPIASLGDHGTSSDLLQRSERVLLDRDYGSILFSPNGDRSRVRKTQFDPKSIPTILVGLMKEYPAGASPWLPKALPGEAWMGSYMKRDLSVPAASPLDLTYKPDPDIGYMTEAYFARMKEVLTFVHAQGRFATYYDEVGFSQRCGRSQHPEQVLP